MPICEQCDGESFYDEDGLFFCDACHTQSQDIRVELKQEADFEKSNVESKTLGIRSIKKKVKRKFKNNCLGKPWIIYEGFQYMIKCQVESLIAMGFNEKLKDCVGKLWFHYLKLSKIAFCSEEPETLTLKEHSKRKHNEGEWNTWLKKRRGLVNKDELTNKEIDELDGLKNPSDAEISANEEVKDNIEETIEDNNSSDEGKCDSIGSVKVSSKAAPVFKMQQRYTLYFCYVGLVLLKEPVLLCDLIRWAHEGLLPYHKASSVLPQEMKFAGQDATSFCKKMKILTGRGVYYGLHKIYETLKIPLTFDKDYIKLLVSSVLVDLDFPSSVQNIAWYLIDIDIGRWEICSRGIRDYIMDGPVSAYIIVALKIIYYLDDQHEMKDEVRSHILNLLKLPPIEETWKEWVTRSMLKRKKKLYNGIPRDEDDLKYIQDLSVYEDYCIKDVFKDFDHRISTTPYGMNIANWRTKKCQDPKEQYFEKFYSVAQLLNPSLDFAGIKRIPSSFPCSVDHLGNLIQCGDAQACSCFTKKHINNISLNSGDKKNDACNSFITDSDKQANVKVYKDSGEITTEVSNDQLDPIDHIKEKLNDMDYNFISHDGKHDMTFSDVYISYAKDQDEDAWSDSYRYLMGVISRRMEALPRDLQHFVRTLEYRCFDVSDKKKPSRR